MECSPQPERTVWLKRVQCIVLLRNEACPFKQQVLLPQKGTELLQEKDAPENWPKNALLQPLGLFFFQAEEASDHPFGQATKAGIEVVATISASFDVIWIVWTLDLACRIQVEAEDGTPQMVSISKEMDARARIGSKPQRGAKAAGWVALEKTESPEPCSRDTIQPTTPELSFPLSKCQRPHNELRVVPHPRKKRKPSIVFVKGVGHAEWLPPEDSEEEQKQKQKSKEEDEEALSELFSGSDWSSKRKGDSPRL